MHMSMSMCIVYLYLYLYMHASVALVADKWADLGPNPGPKLSSASLDLGPQLPSPSPDLGPAQDQSCPPLVSLTLLFPRSLHCLTLLFPRSLHSLTLLFPRSLHCLTLLFPRSLHSLTLLFPRSLVPSARAPRWKLLPRDEPEAGAALEAAFADEGLRRVRVGQRVHELCTCHVMRACAESGWASVCMSYGRATQVRMWRKRAPTWRMHIIGVHAASP